MGGLDLWVIYANPTDYPGQFVLRRHRVIAESEGSPVGPDAVALVSSTLEGARAGVPHGSVNLGRWADDDPAIAEVWV